MDFKGKTTDYDCFQECERFPLYPGALNERAATESDPKLDLLCLKVSVLPLVIGRTER